MIVEHVDEPGKAPRGVTLVRGEAGHARDDDDREATRDLEIIELRASAFAQRGKVEPYEASRALSRLERAGFDRQPRILIRTGAHTLEQRRQLRLDGVGERRVVARGALELAQTVVSAAVDFDHLQPLLDQRD